MSLPGALPLSLSIGNAQGSLYVPSTARYDYAIGGLPFLSAASHQQPIVRESAPIRKQQIDTANVPGEQSLEGWWLRGQQSFHGGAGQLFVDPTGYSGFNIDATPLSRFRYSRNINPWVEGSLTLLNAAKAAQATPIGGVVDATEVIYPDGTDTAVMVGPDNVYVVSASGVNSYTASFTAQPVDSITTDGSYLYASAIDGVWSAPIPATPATAPVWTKQYTISGVTTQTHLAFVKQRLMLGAGPSVYELVPHPGSPPAALPTAKYTSPDPAWRWYGFTESAAAIYAVGNNGVRGSILKFVLDNTGTIPTLSSGAVAAQLPSGEVVYSAYGYLGDFVGIGTSKGVRVAVADTSGNLSYGPILFDLDTAPRCWSARDRFLFVAVSRGIDGDSGVCRIDLSTQVQDLRFAYATDLNYAGDTSNAMVVAHLGDSLTLSYATVNNVYVEDATSKAATGYLQTSRIRFGTLEPKLYKRVKARGPSISGALSFQVLDQADDPAGTFSYPSHLSPADVGDVDISQPQDPMDFISLKWTFQSTNQRVNLLPNPSFETDVSNWSALNGNSGAPVRVTTWAAKGFASGQITCTTAGAVGIKSSLISVTAGLPYAVQAQLKTPTNGLESYIQIDWHDGVGGYLSTVTSTPSAFPPANTPTSLSVVGTAPAGAATCTVYVTVNGAHVGDTFLFDAFLLEQSAVVGTYFDSVLYPAGPEMWGYQVKALPGVRRQRIIQLPMLCFDHEAGPDGQRRGYKGSALARLMALEDLERNGNSVIFQDFNAKSNTTCVIEQISFKQTATVAEPTGFGGIVTVTLRTI